MCYLWKFLYQEFSATFTSTNKDRQTYMKRSKIFQLMASIKTIFISFAKNLLNTSLFDHRLDTSSGHLFQTGKERCHCGLLETQERSKPSASGSLINMFEPVDFARVNFAEMLCHELSEREHAEGNLNLMDCLESKVNCLMICREVVSSILQVGVFLHDWSVRTVTEWTEHVKIFYVKYVN